MTELDTRRLLEAAADQYDAGPPDVDTLIRDGRAARKRRRIIEAVGAAVAVTVVALAVSVVAGSSLNNAQPANPNSDVPVGMRLVGFHGVAVTVPDTWLVGDDPDPGCKRLDHGIIVFPSGVVPQLTPNCSPKNATLHFLPMRDADILNELRYQRRVGNLRETEVDGHRVYRSKAQSVSRCNGRPCSELLNQGLLVPDMGVMIVVNARRHSTITAVLESLRIIPEGWVAVPDVAGLGGDEAAHAVEDAGLSWQNGCPPGNCLELARFRNTSPPIGSVVEEGTVVRPKAP
jgi:hypothetical protein